jgi:hypothetical protein
MAAFDYDAGRNSFPVAVCAAGLSATDALLVLRMPFALPSKNFLLRLFSAPGLESVKSALMPLEYGAYTSTPTIPWIVREDVGATAGLDRRCARRPIRRAGRDEGTRSAGAEQKNWTKKEDRMHSDDVA